MALAVTLLASGELDLGTSGHTVSEQVGPLNFAAGSHVLVVLGASTGGTGPGSPFLTATASGLSFAQAAGGLAQFSAFRANARALIAGHAAGGSTTLTISSGTIEVHGIFYAIYEVTGQAETPVGATAGNADTATDGVRSLTLSAAPAASSIVIAGICISTNPGTNQVTAGAGWTEDAMVDSAGGSNFDALQTQRRTGSTSTSVQWADIRPAGSAQVFSTAAVAVELVEGDAGGDETTGDPLALGLDFGTPEAVAAFQRDADPAPLAVGFGTPTVHVDHVTIAEPLNLTMAFGTPVTHSAGETVADPLAVGFAFGQPTVAAAFSTTAQPFAFSLAFTDEELEPAQPLPAMSTVLPDPTTLTEFDLSTSTELPDAVVVTDLPALAVLTTVEG